MNIRTNYMIVSFIIFIALVFQPVVAQNKKPTNSEIKQDKQALLNKSMMWQNQEKEFSDTTIPEKWKNESRVFLCMSYKEVFEREGNKLNNNSYYHARIKLLDKNAVNDYSEFSFNNDFKSRSLFYKRTANYYVGFKIIKPDGTEHEVNIEDAVEVNYQQGRKNSGYNKVAVPGLEIGDIVDYYFINEKQFTTSTFYTFQPDWHSLVGDYPIKKQYMTLQTSPQIYLNARSINGAPKLKLVNFDKEFKTYVLQDSMRDKVDESEYLRMATSFPQVKIQAFYSSSSSKPLQFTNIYMSMVGERVNIKESLDVNDLKGLSKYLSKNSNNVWTGGVDLYSVYIKKTNKYLTNTYDKKTSSKSDIAKDAFYFLREYNLQTNLLIWASQGKITSNIYLRPLDWFSAIHVLATIYTKWDVPFNFIYTVPNTISTMDDWLFVDELMPMLEVCTEDTILISHFTPHGLVNEIPYEYSGNNGYRVKTLGKKGSTIKVNDTVEPLVLYQNTPDDLKSVVTINARISDFSEPISINYEYEIHGIQKALWDTMLVSKYDGFKEDYTNYKPYIVSPGMTPTKMQEAIFKLEKSQTEYERNRDEQVSEYLKFKMASETLVLDSLYISNTGRWEKKPELIFGIHASINDLHSDVGSSYLFAIGKLLGNKMREHSLEDSILYDFQTSGPYNNQQKLNLTIPNNYYVQDVEQLNMNFENECGSITLNAQYTSDTLVILVDKVLNEQFYNKEKWGSFKELMDTTKSINFKQFLITEKQ